MRSRILALPAALLIWTTACGSPPPTAQVPSPPLHLVATAGNASAQVTWTAPASDGGSPITAYKVVSSPEGKIVPVTAPATNATITDLTNGTTYTFLVFATNKAGDSAASAASNPVTPRTVPDAPTAVEALAGDQSATVSWQAPTNDGGSPVVSFTVTSTPGGFTSTVNASTTSTAIDGLTDGTSYTFTVVATNAAGNSAPSTASNAVTPATAPGAPTGVTAVPGNASATVTWQAPVDNGGSALSAFIVTSNPGSVTAHVDASTTSAALTGLTNGTSYTFTVVAQNAVGTSGPSAPSNAVTPATVPNAPTAAAAVPGDASATVSWEAPGDDGGSAITTYQVTSSPDGIMVTVASPATSAKVANLTNGISYTFTVVAINAIGPSAPSSPSSAVTPATVPAAPSAVTAAGGNESATISWQAPTDNGGSPVLSYTVTSLPGGITATVNAPSTTAEVQGLTNGTSYTFTVVAANAVGSSAPSAASNAVVPSGVPGAPTAASATAGNASATVSWSAPASDGGSVITAYVVTSNPGSIAAQVTAPATQGEVTGLSNGTSYTFTVVALNAVGSSAPSAPSNAVTPATVPNAPTALIATAGSRRIGLSWTAPTSDGGSTLSGYNVYRASASGSLAMKAQIATGVTTTSYTDSSLAIGTTYYYQVTAVNAMGESAGSNEASATPTAAAPKATTAVNAEGNVSSGLEQVVAWNGQVYVAAAGVPTNQSQYPATLFELESGSLVPVYQSPGDLFDYAYSLNVAFAGSVSHPGASQLFLFKNEDHMDSESVVNVVDPVPSPMALGASYPETTVFWARTAPPPNNVYLSGATRLGSRIYFSTEDWGGGGSDSTFPIEFIDTATTAPNTSGPATDVAPGNGNFAAQAYLAGPSGGSQPDGYVFGATNTAATLSGNVAGRTDVWRYDEQTNQVTTVKIPDITTTVNGQLGYDLPGEAALGSVIYFIDNSNHLETWDAGSSAPARISASPYPGAGQGSVVLANDGTLYATDLDADSVTSAGTYALWSYSIATDTWTMVAPLPEATWSYVLANGNLNFISSTKFYTLAIQ